MTTPTHNQSGVLEGSRRASSDSAMGADPATRTRILFVDDDVPILNALRDLLRKDRHRWDMVFASGGAQALAELRGAPFDVVISDMRMPGMDGAELLTTVKREFPAVTRIVLSGHAEQEAVLRAVPVAQQFLSKPCEVSVLRNAIDRTYRLQSLISNARIRAVVGQLAVLPSVPKSYLELRDATANAASGAAQLTAIVERDPAMSAKVLQLVNSAYFGIAHRVTSVQQAVVYLGAELLKSLALTASVFSGLDPNVHRALSLEQLQAHSMRVGRLARRFTLDPKKRDDAFTTGLVHDIGKIILALSLPDGFARMANEAAGGGAPYWELEERAFGVTHAEVGAYLLGVWGLPFSLVESVAFHHKPSDVAEGPCDDLAVLHAADALAHTTDGPTRGSAEPTFDLEFLARAGALERLPQWRRVAEEELGKETPHR